MFYIFTGSWVSPNPTQVPISLFLDVHMRFATANSFFRKTKIIIDKIVSGDFLIP